MGWISFAFLVSSILIVCEAAPQPLLPKEGETLNMLDASVQLMGVQGNSGEFDRDYLSRLSSCMTSLHPDLWAVSDGAWAGCLPCLQWDRSTGQASSSFKCLQGTILGEV